MVYEMGPRSRRIHEQLRERILIGELAPGTKLPAHTELAKTYGVAPLTVRQVLARLETEGLVSREQGRGTFVRQPTLPGVLIVEDDAQVGELLAEIVRMSGARAFLTTNVESALEALMNETGIRLVLSDVSLPDASDGVELIRAIRRRYPDIPVAAAIADHAELAGLHGAPEAPILVLSKPYRSSHVREALRLVLGREISG